MAKTKDEKFLLALFEMASERGSPHAPCERNEVGRRIGLSPKGIKAICVLLAQANFIQKEGGEEISLTQHGLSLVRQLQG